MSVSYLQLLADLKELRAEVDLLRVERDRLSVELSDLKIQIAKKDVAVKASIGIVDQMMDYLEAQNYGEKGERK